MKKLLLGTLFALLFGTTHTVYADTWRLVTDASALQSGDQLVLACRSKSVTAADIASGKDFMDVASSTFSGDEITSLGAETVILTLGGKEGAWTLSNAAGKLLGTTKVKTIAWGNGTTTWGISISKDGTATIQSTTSSYGRFLYNVNNPRFTTYTSNTNTVMLLPQLYRLEKPAGYTFIYEGFAGNTTRCEGGKTCQEGEVITLSAGTPTKEGSTFAGWLYNGKIYQAGDPFTMPAANVALVPQWKGTPTESGTDTPTIRTAATKVLRDGYLYIMVNDKTYNATGRIIND